MCKNIKPISDPVIRVGIMEGAKIRFRTTGNPQWREVNRREVTDAGGELLCAAPGRSGGFELDGVTIGVGFHWERQEPQRFEGQLILKCIPNSDKIVAINEIDVEAYLRSVISSEMSADASEEFLKAHAITSRSWLLRQLRDVGKHAQGRTAIWSVAEVDKQHVRELTCWHDREDHTLFDVCADDHCQRYQGVTRQTSPTVARAVDATCGVVLTYGGEICDARFSKCCGGKSEVFGACWEDAEHPYLVSVDDPYCLRATPGILAQVLNGYDRECPGFDEWTETYTGPELAGLVSRKSGIDFGDILELRPLARGASGRITRLLVRGSRNSVVVGKELEIRRWLSTSHLRSSWFDVEGPDAGGNVTLHGRGWGHGVGLCQIGAAVMGAEGSTAKQILQHYFPKSELSKLY